MILVNILLGIIVFLIELIMVGYVLLFVLVLKNVLFVLCKFGFSDYFMKVVDFVSFKYGKFDFEIFWCGVEILGFNLVDCIGVEDVVVGV